MLRFNCLSRLKASQFDGLEIYLGACLDVKVLLKIQSLDVYSSLENNFTLKKSDLAVCP